MALFNCDECQKPISDLATECPHCGGPTLRGSRRERFELGIEMMKEYRDEIERRLIGTSAGIVALLLGQPAARHALARQAGC